MENTIYISALVSVIGSVISILAMIVSYRMKYIYANKNVLQQVAHERFEKKIEVLNSLITCIQDIKVELKKVMTPSVYTIELNYAIKSFQEYSEQIHSKYTNSLEFLTKTEYSKAHPAQMLVIHICEILLEDTALKLVSELSKKQLEELKHLREELNDIQNNLQILCTNLYFDRIKCI